MQSLVRGTIYCIYATAVLGCDGGGYVLTGAPPPPESPPAAERVPLTEMGTGTYLGFTGGLYAAGYIVPSTHDSVGRAEAARIQPRDAFGNPSTSGKYVLLSIGMSNTTQEFCGQSGTTSCNAWTFGGQAAADPAVNRTTLVIANGAAGGKSAAFWDDAADPDYDRVRDQVLSRLGVTDRQVQVAWVKVANPGPSASLPNVSADAYTLVRQMGGIARAMRQRYPNIRQIFFSSRTFGGFATTSLNPEPYAYESGFAVKWVIQAQIDQRQSGTIDSRAGDLRYDQTPWLAWGPYLWSGNTGTPMGSLVWVRSDFEGDGTHPAQSGEEKVAAALLSFFKSSPYTACWFLAGRTC